MPRGEKICSQCETIIGTKASKCGICGFSFTIRSKHKNRKKNFSSVLRYVSNRIKGNNYRDHRCEHHRATTDSRKVKLMLEILKDGTHPRLKYVVPNTVMFGMIVRAINKEMGFGTLNSFRKNILVDLDKMGYIDRLDSSGKPVLGKRGSPVRAIVLTDDGITLTNVKESNKLRREQMHSSATIKLLGKEYVNNILSILDEFEEVSIIEFMYFINGETDISKIARYIEKYRTLTDNERASIDNEVLALVDKMNTKAQGKKGKRSILGWENEVIQICENLKNIPGFNFRDELLTK